MAAIGCTIDEIGGVLGCTGRTIEKRCHPQLERGWAKMKVSLKRRQWKIAHDGKGNVGMLIWLGKQYLGQSEKNEITQTQTGPTEIKVIRDPNWYGNLHRFTSDSTRAPNGNANGNGQKQNGGVRPAVGQNGNGTDGSD